MGGGSDVTAAARNPDRPSTMPLVNVPEGEMDTRRKAVKRISSPEKWELKQMMSAGCIDKSELPDFDEETGKRPRAHPVMGIFSHYLHLLGSDSFGFLWLWLLSSLLLMSLLGSLLLMWLLSSLLLMWLLGMLAKDDDGSGDEDVEIELVEEEPPFLKGCGRQLGLDMSPVKIVKVRASIRVHGGDRRGWRWIPFDCY